MTSNPTSEPTVTGTTDQFTGTAPQQTRDLAEQRDREQSGVHDRTRRQTDEASGVGAMGLRGVVPGVDPNSATAAIDVVLHAERLLISRGRCATERVRFSKQVVMTTRTIEVPVRIEQLVVSHEPFPPDTPANSTATTPTNTLADAGGERANDVVIVLHEEVPEFTLRVEPVERVTIGIHTVVAEQTITATLGSETVSIDQS